MSSGGQSCASVGPNVGVCEGMMMVLLSVSESESMVGMWLQV